MLVRERGRTEGDEFERLIAAPLRRLFESARSEARVRHEIPPGVLAESLLGIVAGVLGNCSLGRDDTVATIRTVFLEGAFAPQRPDQLPAAEGGRATVLRPKSKRRSKGA